MSLTTSNIIVSAFEPLQRKGWFIFYEKAQNGLTAKKSLPLTAFPFEVTDIDEVVTSAISGYMPVGSKKANMFYFITASNPTITFITLTPQKFIPKIANPKKQDVEQVTIKFTLPNPQITYSIPIEKLIDFGLIKPLLFYQ